RYIVDFQITRLCFPTRSSSDLWFKYNLAKLKYFKNLPLEEQKLRSRISREIIKNEGLINYIGFNDSKYIDKLTKHFKWNLSGIEVFKFLVNYRYKNKVPFGKYGNFRFTMNN
ncbi:MAG: hypothetical protein RAK22_02020, partial [Nanoarchaeota archaeon]|nr:hypothetical protein [Nanoarchaeota archaeon]